MHMSNVANRRKSISTPSTTHEKTLNKLSLVIQYVAPFPETPNRQQFRKWVKTALVQNAEIVIRIVDQEEGLSLNQRFRENSILRMF